VRRRILLALAICGGAAIIAAVGSTSWLGSFGARPAGARLERMRKSPHFVDGKFVNAVPTNKMAPGAFSAMLRHQLFGSEERVPKRPIPVSVRDAADYAKPPGSGLRVTWIGHASTLIEIDGKRVVTDPIWSERCSPSTWLGPKRFHPPPIPLQALPIIDIAMISHDHYDHLDMSTVQALGARGTRFLVPLGVGAHLEKWGIAVGQIIELDWNEAVNVDGLKIIATPARHYSGRNPLHNDNTLWASWVVKGPVHRVFFSGDSGYFDGFKEIGAQHGPFDLALVKIGACDVTWPDIHMTPEEAVQATIDVRGKLLLPVHWGTFNLAFHAWNDPAERVLAAAHAAGTALIVPRPGELIEPSHMAEATLVLPGTQPVIPWWR
jgi:L-ascorbate metabolism protein UlaG (beta-lactamase superfamily)